MTQLAKLFMAGFELTTACPCHCVTCGSNAGKPRRDELDTEQWLDQVRAIARLGAKRLCLLGGEPFLHPGWQTIARLGHDLGLDVDMISCGVDLDDDSIEAAKQSGLVWITFSVDGTEPVHDRQRGVRDGYRTTLEAIRRFDEAGLKVGVTTQLNRETLPTLEALAQDLQIAGAMGWQLQLTVPLGRAREHQALMLLPSDMPETFSVIRRLVRRRGLRPYITDNLGYMTADDPLLRTPPMCPDRCWCGCQAGLRSVGITSRGDVKGCLSLPDQMVEGNVRNEPLERIWSDMSRFAYNRSYQSCEVDSDCANCRLESVCRGGCTSVSVVTTGKPHQGPYCVRREGEEAHG
jgi:radical SAM protein with 4Fe4S-binding SPASM domain